MLNCVSSSLKIVSNVPVGFSEYGMINYTVLTLASLSYISGMSALGVSQIGRVSVH